jgi:prepilin-type N-terminal cleavage/methylation domain-containing protein
MKYIKGLTLVEIIISIAILTLIASLGLFISMDFFKNYSFRSEKNVIVSILQNARSQSINNIDQVRHGIHFQANPIKYIEFECPVSTPQCSSYSSLPSEFIINSSYNISFSNPTLPFDIIFDQLNGNCINCTSPINIVVIDGTKQYTININSEGRIDW